MGADTLGWIVATLAAVGLFLLMALPLTIGLIRPATPMKRCPFCGVKSPAARGGNCWKCGLDHVGLSQDALRPDKPPMDLSYFDLQRRRRRGEDCDG